MVGEYRGTTEPDQGSNKEVRIRLHIRLWVRVVLKETKWEIELKGGGPCRDVLDQIYFLKIKYKITRTS